MAAKTQTKALMIYLNNRVVLEALNDADRGRLTLALLDYLEYGSLPAFDGALGMAFLVLQKDVDRSVERWEEECARRSAAGKKSAALRAAKNFTQNVSCEGDLLSYEAEEAAETEAGERNDSPAEDGTEAAAAVSAERCSTELNSVEVSPTAGTYSNSNPNSNPYSYPKSYSNQNPNPNSDQSPNTSLKPKELPGSARPAGARERDFARFWQAYPKKVGKQAARKAFLRSAVSLDTLLQALERQRADPQWQRENGRFIPHPVTWLNQARWEDEPAAPTSQDCRPYGIECL